MPDPCDATRRSGADFATSWPPSPSSLQYGAPAAGGRSDEKNWAEMARIF